MGVYPTPCESEVGGGPSLGREFSAGGKFCLSRAVWGDPPPRGDLFPRIERGGFFVKRRFSGGPFFAKMLGSPFEGRRGALPQKGLFFGVFSRIVSHPGRSPVGIDPGTLVCKGIIAPKVPWKRVWRKIIGFLSG